MERIESLLKILGNPQVGFQSVHVAGTNGKGSTCWIIASILHEAGYRVGSFLSPHIYSYRERISINDEYIEARDLNDYLDQVLSAAAQLTAAGGEHPTEFEILTAIAFRYFKDRQVDIAVVEVGMGGLYDSTNVINPLVSIISSIDYDHTDYLGETLEEIAFNKAGIIKPGVPVVTGDVPASARRVIEEQSRQKRAPLYANSTVKVVRNGSELDGMVDVSFPDGSLGTMAFSLLGEYQLTNLSTALTAVFILRQQGYAISGLHIKKALAAIGFAGRLQLLSREPLIIADAAHNPHACRALHSALASLWPGRERVLVLGMLDSKDASSSVRELGKTTRAVVITCPDKDRAQNWSRLSSLFASLHPGVLVYESEDPNRALELGLGILKENEYMLICGSFYLLGKVLSQLAGGI